MLLWSLRGQQPAQETRCFDNGNTDMSGSISERMAIAVIGFLSSLLILSKAIGVGNPDACIDPGLVDVKPTAVLTKDFKSQYKRLL